LLSGVLIAIAGFILGVRVGLAVGYRAERGRQILSERKWLAQLAGALRAKPPEFESIVAARARLLEEATRAQVLDEARAAAAAAAGPQT
jgi:hypothetical protein